MTKKTYRTIGVMSGTSLDGVDLCEAQFAYHNNRWVYNILKTKTIAYNKSWKTILKNAHQYSPKNLKEIDFKYCKLLADYLLNFMDNPDVIDMVCSHGHTVWHQPENGITYQIGNLEMFSKLINKTVVCDFRSTDVALGGQGAPLVPVGDKLLFSDYDYCINIGGFANISYQDKGKTIAFDICGANKVLNFYVEKLNFEFDNKGNIASKGVCSYELLEQLNALDFYDKTAPKSLGIEWLEDQLLPIIESFNLPIPDILNTLCHHIAIQITRSIQKSKSKILITGGGAYHEYLISLIKQNNPEAQIYIPGKELIDYKEALIFGFLGVLRYRNEINVLQSVTGAKYDHSSGRLFEYD